jgi:FkbM family methyltransferase
MMHQLNEIYRFLVARKVLQPRTRWVHYDLGSAGGIPWRLLLLASTSCLRIVGFDAQPEWKPPKSVLGRVLGTIIRRRSVSFAACVLGDGDSSFAVLHCCKNPGCSSLRIPNNVLLKRYPGIRDWFEVTKTIHVKPKAISEVVREQRIEIPDTVKIDIQGCEYEALRGFGDLLSGISAVECEVQFLPVYEGQHLFGDICELLGSKGFVLQHLERQGPFGHDLVEANAFWIRNDLSPRQQSIVNAWRVLHGLPA